MFRNRMQRRIFGPKRDKATGCWTKLYNDDLHDMYSFTNYDQIKDGEILRAWTT
jgi:hypothetical protein